MPESSDFSAARAFISRYITSAEQLDVLLLLYREKERDFTAAEVSQRIYTVPTSATLRLEELIALDLIRSNQEADPRYRYAPGSPSLSSAVDSLAKAYQADRVAVIRLIFSAPPNPAAAFADAFRIRREER